MVRNSRAITKGHVILFLQPTDEESRTWADFKSLEDAWCGMCEMFEETYRRRQNVEEVSYDIDDVIHFFSSYQEVLMMVFDDEFEHYVPHDSEWVMEHLNDY